ncbi:hypothetical protein E4198_04090 [Streptomyces sp. RKND-216]|nr:hypothetical protein E4198_04090 [Streptomyces sp. RKND-216]
MHLPPRRRGWLSRPQRRRPRRAHRAEHWDALYAAGRGFAPLGDTERRLLADLCPARAGALALEVGCGLGELVLRSPVRGTRTTATS